MVIPKDRRCDRKGDRFDLYPDQRIVPVAPLQNLASIGEYWRTPERSAIRADMADWFAFIEQTK
jgi:hypothetical protein